MWAAEQSWGEQQRATDVSRRPIVVVHCLGAAYVKSTVQAWAIAPIVFNTLSHGCFSSSSAIHYVCEFSAWVLNDLWFFLRCFTGHSLCGSYLWIPWQLSLVSYCCCAPLCVCSLWLCPTLRGLTYWGCAPLCVGPLTEAVLHSAWAHFVLLNKLLLIAIAFNCVVVIHSVLCVHWAVLCSNLAKFAPRKLFSAFVYLMW